MNYEQAKEINERATALRLAAQNFDTYTVGGESKAQRLVREWLEECPALNHAKGVIEEHERAKESPNAKP